MMIQKPVLFLFAVSLFAGVAGCELDRDDRCDQGLRFFKGTCQFVFDNTGTDTGDTGTDTATTSPPGDAGVVDGGGTDTETGGPTIEERGFGLPCGTEADCAGREASYCVRDPLSGDPGYCSFKDCETAPDDCPEDLVCCDFPDGIPVPNFCMEPGDSVSVMCQNLNE